MARIFIGADHNGYQLKEMLEAYLKAQGHQVTDMGDKVFDAKDDFPQFAARVATRVLATKDSVGILICGSGQGVCIAANRYKGIRASLAWNEAEARASRNDDDSNILCLPSRELTDPAKVKTITDTWLTTPFAAAPRFTRRIKQLDELS